MCYDGSDQGIPWSDDFLFGNMYVHVYTFRQGFIG